MGGRGASIQNCYRTSKGRCPARGDASLMKRDDNFARYIRNRRDIDPNGEFDVIAHGTAISMEVNHLGKALQVDSRTAAKIISRLPGYHGQSIRLLACNTGAELGGFAQNLANKLGVPVRAPNNTLWAYPNGRYVIAPDNGRGNPDYRKRGRFVQYHPGGNKR